jgi:prepilin-type N-terminal cleavage/methylation domain-containing protein
LQNARPKITAIRSLKFATAWTIMSYTTAAVWRDHCHSGTRALQQQHYTTPLGDEFMKRSKKGFTLIELLIVVVIIGILAAIAIPKFAATKERAYVATMKTDLKNLVTAEEGFASANNGTYFSGTVDNTAGGTLPVVTTGSYVPSAGVKVVVALNAAAGALPAGWSAVATSKQTQKVCDIFVNQKAGVTYATDDGVPNCMP